jgi:hypothetical protein
VGRDIHDLSLIDDIDDGFDGRSTNAGGELEVPTRTAGSSPGQVWLSSAGLQSDSIFKQPARVCVIAIAKT